MILRRHSHPTRDETTTTETFRALESAVVRMYSTHPSPSRKDKLEFASSRMALRLRFCGVSEEDYVGRDVLDAGCGTGEYSCWFASRGSRVTGIDLSDGSLKEAQAYARAAGLKGIQFEKRSVLQSGFPDESFDLVYCTGVLHHTPDPFRGLTELTRLVRPGGKILVSVYNSFGFFPRELRRQVALHLGGESLDERVRWGRRLFPFTTRRLLSGPRNDPEAALYDYFAIPHETLHSLGEVLKWFDQLGLEYVGSFAPARFRDYPALVGHWGYKKVDRSLYSPLLAAVGRLSSSSESPEFERPGPFSRLLVQIMWLFSGIGVFCLCGRKPRLGSA